MSRKALLIGCPEGETYLHGVDKDLDALQTFMKSPLGGAWRPEEITVLRSPGKVKLLAAIKTLKDAEYSFTHFGGHGGVDARSKETIVGLGGGEELNEYELKAGALKHTLILDCCRVVMKPTTITLDEALAKALRYKSALSAQDCRAYFDKAIREASPGANVLYACSINETAGEDQDGGFYTASLREAALDWFNDSNVDTSQNYSLLSIPKAHETADRKARRKSGERQHPRQALQRTGPYAPFAVIA